MAAERVVDRSGMSTGTNTIRDEVAMARRMQTSTTIPYNRREISRDFNGYPDFRICDSVLQKQGYTETCLSVFTVLWHGWSLVLQVQYHITRATSE
jgi:hypothetical protein